MLRHRTLLTSLTTCLPQIPESCRPNMEEGISLFSSLLNNKHFLIVFVHALEQQKDFAVRDRSGCGAGSREDNASWVRRAGSKPAAVCRAPCPRGSQHLPSQALGLWRS